MCSALHNYINYIYRKIAPVVGSLPLAVEIKKLLKSVLSGRGCLLGVGTSSCPLGVGLGVEEDVTALFQPSDPVLSVITLQQLYRH